MSSSDQIYLESDFAADGYLSEPPLPPLQTVYVHVLIHTGKGGEGESLP
jgi:hypothetical protein